LRFRNEGIDIECLFIMKIFYRQSMEYGCGMKEANTRFDDTGLPKTMTYNGTQLIAELSQLGNYYDQQIKTRITDFDILKPCDTHILGLIFCDISYYTLCKHLVYHILYHSQEFFAKICEFLHPTK
jgi:hypothetical protein